MHSYSFLKPASLEHYKNLAYYEEKQEGLGYEYQNDFFETINTICEMPNIYRIIIKPDIKRVSFERFPFLIMYRTNNKNVEILAIGHKRRKDNYWINRASSF